MSDIPLVLELTILVLAIFLGFEVISKVPAMLHTPLMSGTNFIHGIVIVGAIIVLGHADDTMLKILGFVAMVLASANVVGGVTIVGHPNLPSLMASDASRLYARNMVTLLGHLAPGGELTLDFDDEITAGACVARPEEGR